MAQATTPQRRPFCVRFGGALALPLVMAGVVICCIVAAILIALTGAVLVHFHLKPGAHDEIYAFSLFCDFLALWLLMAPVFAYLNVGQVKKVEVIRGFYSPDLIAEYFDQFWRGRDAIANLIYRWRNRQPAQRDALTAELDERFRSIIVEDFGGGVYIIPALILVAIGFITLFFGFAGGIAYAEKLLLPADKIPPVMPLGLRLDLTSIAAIFGAYTWVASDSIMRAHQWTLHPSDLSWYALRLLISVPLGQAIATAAPSGMGAFMAFVISMFSLDAIKKYLSAAATRLGNSPAGSPAERDDVVIRMAGVDEAASDALRAEGIGTIAQLTTVDPIRVSILTGLPFEYVLSLIDSAILWTFFRDKTDQLREFGLRGASGLIRCAEPSGAGLALAATALANAEAALATCQRAVDAATADLDAATSAAGANPMTLDAAQQALTAIMAEPDQAAAAPRRQAMEATLAALRHLSDCHAALDAATAHRDAALTTANDARVALRTLAAKDALFDAIQTKVGISSLGLSQAAAQLSADSYAGFIRRLLAL